MLAVLVGVPTWRRRDREQLARARRARRLPGPRRLRRPLRRHAVHRHPPHLRAGVHPRARAPGHLPRRADRRRRPARDRGVRPAHLPHPGRARRVAARHRARHAVRDVDQRPRATASRPARSSPRDRPTRCATTPASSRRTSAPTSGRSSAPGGRRRASSPGDRTSIAVTTTAGNPSDVLTRPGAPSRTPPPRPHDGHDPVGASRRRHASRSPRPVPGVGRC